MLRLLKNLKDDSKIFMIILALNVYFAYFTRGSFKTLFQFRHVRTPLLVVVSKKRECEDGMTSLFRTEYYAEYSAPWSRMLGIHSVYSGFGIASHRMVACV